MNSDKNPALSGAYVKNYYNKFLSSYDKEYSFYRWESGPVERLHYTQTRSTLIPLLKQIKGSVLEIGGGDAVWTREYIEQIERLTFLDISDEMIVRAKKRLELFQEKITYVNNDFLQNNFSGTAFDAVVSIRNLEYFTDKEKFISEVKRLLKKDGQFILVTKSPKYNLHDRAKNKTLHTSQINIKDLICMIQRYDFEIYNVQPAIFGKLFRFAITRSISNLLQKVFSLIPWRMLPIGLLAYFSESFMIYAKKK